MKDLKNVACLIRTWSDNAGIADTVHRAITSEIGHVLVVVKDEDAGHERSVAARLADLIVAHQDRITILAMREGYSWSNALNYGFDEVRRMNLRAAELGAPRIAYVLNVSNEAWYSREDVEALLTEAETDECIGAVGTTFQGWQDDRPIELGASYAHPRNTMLLVRFSAYLAIGGFDPRCDQLGGQEDIDWLMRLAQTGGRWSLIDRNVKLLIPQGFDQVKKEARERKAMVDMARVHEEVAERFAEFAKGLR